MPCEKGKHLNISRTVWEPFELVHNIFVSQKMRILECTRCGHIRRLSINERRRYGNTHPPISLNEALEGEDFTLTRSLLHSLATSTTRKKWNSWKSKWVETTDYSLFDDCIERLFRWGLVIKQEKKLSFGIQSWELTYIFANRFLESEIMRLLEIEPPSTLSEDTLSDITNRNLNPTSTKGNQIKELVLKLQSEKQTPSTLRLLKTLLGLFEMVEEQKTMSWKSFSQLYFGSTKALQEHDKVRLRKLLGSKLSEYGIRSSSSRVFISGDFSWEIQGYTNHGLGFLGSLSLPRTMISHMQMMSWKSPHLLIIENKDLFESLVDSQTLNPQKWAILFGKGFLSTEEMSIICHASRFSLNSITIWPDLDPFGLSIALNLKRKLIDANISIPVFLFGFTIDWINQIKVKAPLTTTDLEEITRLGNYSLPTSCLQVLEWMRTYNQKHEQEIAFELLNPSTLEMDLFQDRVEL